MSNIFGYMQYYFKLDLGDKVAYAMDNSDFSKPITQEIFDDIINTVKLGYEEQGLQVISIEPCTKEEYNKEPKAPMTDIIWKDGKEPVVINSKGKKYRYKVIE